MEIFSPEVFEVLAALSGFAAVGAIAFIVVAQAIAFAQDAEK